MVSGADKDGGREEVRGSILNRYEYDAWGNLTDCEETVENRFKFNGQQYDPITQQYYLRARYYNPVIGRFTQEDIYRNDGLNLYVYCRNNPVYYVDPSGNICDPAAQRIMEQFGADGHCTASRNEQKKLAAYLRNKERQGGTLSDRERNILNQINDYTYLSRYNQTMPSHLSEGDTARVIYGTDDIANYQYNMIENPGPLAEMPNQPAKNFYGGRYNMEVLQEDKIMYRAGNAENPYGRWFTSEPPASVANVRIDTAVKPHWIDPKTGAWEASSYIDNVYAIKIPKGTTVYTGPVGPQGGAYMGGYNIMQTYIDAPWSFEVIGKTPLQ